MSRVVSRIGRDLVLAAAFFCAAASGACADVAASTSPADPMAENEEVDEYAMPPVSDPLERVNRTIFKFNDSVYRKVMKPIARGYQKVVPRIVRRGLGSFFDNIRFPVRFLSCALQGKFDRSAAETGKFLINSTVGVGGFIKVSDRIPELQVPEEDVGQAFGKWGFKPGPYIVLPVLGPSSVRDTFGRVGDMACTPTSWRFWQHYDWRWRAGVITTDVVNSTPDIIDMYESMKQSAIDPYVAMRNGYLDYREAAVKK